jgi:hypothetical protein
MGTLLRVFGYLINLGITGVFILKVYIGLAWLYQEMVRVIGRAAYIRVGCLLFNLVCIIAGEPNAVGGCQLRIASCKSEIIAMWTSLLVALV